MPCNLSNHPGFDSEFTGPAGETSTVTVRLEDGQPPAAVEVVRASYAGQDITDSLTFEIQEGIEILRLFVEASARVWVQLRECCDSGCGETKMLRRFKADPRGVDRAYRVLGQSS